MTSEIRLVLAQDEIQSSLKNKHQTQLEESLEKALKRCNLYFQNLHTFVNWACDYQIFLDNGPKIKDFNRMREYLNSDKQKKREEVWKNQERQVQFDIAPYHLEYVRRSFINLNEGVKILPYLLVAYYINSHDDMLGALTSQLGTINPISQKSDLDIFTKYGGEESGLSKKREIFSRRFSLKDFNDFKKIQR